MNYQITKAISVEFNKNEIIRLSKEMETEISRLTKAMESDIQHIHEEPDAKVHLDGLPELLLHWPHKDFNLKEVMPFLYKVHNDYCKIRKLDISDISISVMYVTCSLQGVVVLPYNNNTGDKLWNI